MNTFLGWATYSTRERYCDVCETFYDKQDEWEHKDCEKELGDEKSMKLYDIVRFYRDLNKQTKVIKYGVTLENAQKHCSRDDTSGDGWFDGYRESEPR